MDTKLKNILRNNAVKLIAFILAVVFMTTGIVVLDQTTTNMKDFSLSDLWDNQEYMDSFVLNSYGGSTYRNLYNLIHEYQSEEYIRSGALIKEDRLRNQKMYLYNQDCEKGLWGNSSDYETAVPEDFAINIINSDEFNKIHEKDIEAFKKKEIDQQLSEYSDILNDLETDKKELGLKWYAKSDEYVSTSDTGLKPEKLRQSKAYYNNDKGKIDTSFGRGDGYESSSYKNVDSQIVFAYDDNIIKNLEQDYLQNHANGLQAFQVFFICSVLSLVVLVAVCIGAGRRMDDEAVYLRFIDHLYLDVHGAGLLLVESMTFTFALASSHYNLPQYIPAVIVFVSIVLLYNFVLSFTRIAKAHQIKEKILILKGFRKMKVFFKKIECFKRIKALGRKLRGYYHQVLKGSPLVLIYMGAVILCVGLGMLFIWAWPLAIVLFCAALWFVGKHAKSLDLVINGVERVQAGEVNYKIETQGYGKIEKMAENINCINEGMNRAIKDAVEKELKSERLKTELITNVSHDIRTPLTSIITYIDLLKKEDIDEESRKRYITVLENKAARLKTLTDDLFEAAKASTGNIEVNLDKVNIESLINQGMGELEDKIKAADLEFIVKRPEEKIIVEADGRLLWRVLENLLNNVLKYAMKGSRVYVTIDQDLFSQMGVIVIKNISAQALNIQPEELMERFKRGDDTRHSDGSGLGLAIAKDLTELQNGRFQLEIDGDLFKTTVYLKMTEATEATEAECETP